VSHTPTSPNAEHAAYAAGWAAMFALIRTGGSWSGRETGCAYLNTGSLPFADVSAVSGLNLPDDSRALASGDWDGDGRIDLWLSARTGPRLRFLRNEHATVDYVAFELEGVQSNRDAIGTRIELWTDDLGTQPLVRTLSAGDSFLAQSSRRLHFGLAGRGAVQRAVIHWPSGRQQTLEQVERNATLHVREGDESVRTATRKPVRLEAEPLAPHVPSERARIPFTNRLPLPQAGYRSLDGGTRPLFARNGKATLINLWASWCAPCMKELKQFGHERARLADDLNLIALNVEQELSASDIAAHLERLNWPFAAGRADAATLELLDAIQTSMLNRSRPLPLPTSLLIDAEGRACVLYKGPIEVTNLVRDVEWTRLDDAEYERAGLPFAGRWLGERRASPVLAFASQLSERGLSELAEGYLARLRVRSSSSAEGRDRASNDLAQAQLAIARERKAAGDSAGAHSALQRALELAPTSVEALNELGQLDEGAGRLAQAVERYRAALEIDGENIAVLINLANALNGQGKPQEARTIFRAVLEREPEHALANYNMGVITAVAGETSLSVEHLRRAARAQADFFEAHHALGHQLHATRQFEEASRVLHHASELRPENADVLAKLFEVWTALGEANEAQRTFEQLKGVSPTRAAALERAASGN